MAQPQELINFLNTVAKDDQWHQTMPTHLIENYDTYVKWDEEKVDWRFITIHKDGKQDAGYVGINE